MPKLRIGYIPNRMDLEHPADRRRVVYWANHRGHEIHLDLTKKVDVLLLSNRSDLRHWTQLKSRPPLIIDLVDGYLGGEKIWRDWARGIGKLATGQISGTPNSYQGMLKSACSLAEAVVCETLEQVKTIEPYCKNTHHILDFHEEFPMEPFREEVKTRNFPAIMWEGLPYTARGLNLLEEALLEMNSSRSVSLEMVTDLTYPLLLGKYVQKRTEAKVGRIPSELGSNFRLTPWSLDSVLQAANRSHLSVLPLDPKGFLNPLKAENRLLMMWRIGLPVLTSPSLAFNRVMGHVGVDGICDTPAAWSRKIQELSASRDLPREHVERGQQYIRETHSKEIVLKAWDSLFESVL